MTLEMLRNSSHLQHWIDCGNDVSCLGKWVQGKAFIGVKFKGVDLTKINFEQSKFLDCDFRGAKLCYTLFNYCNFEGCNFEDADCSGSSFFNAKLCDCEFDGADLYDVDFGRAKICDCETLPDKILYNVCPDCHKYISDAYDFITFSDTGRTVCCDCADERGFKCEYCEEWYEYNSTEHFSDDSHTYCYDCYTTHLTTCSQCGRIINCEDAYYNEDDGEYYCDTCWNDCERWKSECILNYHQRWDKCFAGSDDGLYLGFELEAGCLDSYEACANFARDIHNPDNYVLMEDGSIDDYGFELISHPWSLKNHLDYGWDVLRRMQNKGMRSHDAQQCGLHVHASRRILNEDTWARLAVFVYRNRKFWEKFARRRGNSYTQYSEMPLNMEEAKENAKSTWERYRAVNFKNADTVEFRFFKGTLRKTTLFATLEMVHALVRFFGQWKYEREPSVGDLLKYIKENDKYKYIYPYLEERHFNVGDYPLSESYNETTREMVEAIGRELADDDDDNLE